MPEALKKSVLVISYGPVPTTEYKIVEGGGMRAWGLAKGLAANGAEVTVAINGSFPQGLAEHEGIRLTTWSPDSQFADLINSYDSVIVSYCMGSDSVFIADHISDDVQLILDVYVPIYVEVSARDSKDMDNEYRNYIADIKRFNHVLRRGDYFLCANESQKIFYTGILGSLGVINPRSYRQNRIIVAPFGVHNEPAIAKVNPYEELGVDKSDFTVLWFGGIYPWFRIGEFMEAIKHFANSKSVRFVVVGGKNPFNANPDFVRQYDKLYEFAVNNNLLNKIIYFVDWVNFEDRINWYKNAHVVISLNQPGEENVFSWRTRVMDYVWGELPIITNGGDPLSEQLIAGNAALRLPELSGSSIATVIESLVKQPALLQTLTTNIKKIKTDYYWHKILAPVEEVIRQSHKPYHEELAYRNKVISNTVRPAALAAKKVLPRQVYRHLKNAYQTIDYARSKGVKKSLRVAGRMIAVQARSRANYSRRYIFISHPINNTGAPLILLQMIDEFASKYGATNIQVVAPHIDGYHLRKLREKGIKVDKAAAGLSDGLIKFQLGLHKNDFVIMNTLAVHQNYQKFILESLANGTLKHAYWFIHEDKAQIPFTNVGLLNKSYLKKINKLVNSKRLDILVPSERIRLDYNELLKTNRVKTLAYHIDVPTIYKKNRDKADFKTINFLLSGTPADGRKGQLIAIAAFHEFIKNFYEKSPELYRDFKLHLIAIGTDYISQQVNLLGGSLLGSKHIRIYPSLPREEALKITSKCNVVICCSLNETFAIYVAEGMLMGHVVLRNNSAGVDEQLKDGVNGYFIDHTDINAFAGVIEKVLNKEITSDEELQKMGQSSQAMIAPYAINTYWDKLV